MINLIRDTCGAVQYWQAWNDNGEVCVNSGEVGHLGAVENYWPPLSQIEPMMRKMAQHMRSQGYRDIDPEDLL